MKYQNDILGAGFESCTIQQPDDYEGEVVCTLIRKQPAITSTKAVLQLHGFNDYFFHSEVAGKYTAQGFNFYALDLRKYGRSYLPHQKFNNVRDLAEYNEDITAALRIIRSEGNKKILLSGHSMGGLIVLLFAHKFGPSGLFDAVFLNSPFFEQNKDIITKKLIIPLAARCASRWPDQLVPGGFSKFYGPSLHKSGHGEWDYRLDWKPHVAPLVNLGWVKAIYEGQRKLKRGLSINFPLLIMHPEKSVVSLRWSENFKFADAVVDVKDIIRLARRIHGPCTMISIENAVHDIMLSIKPVREKVYHTLFGWIHDKTNINY